MLARPFIILLAICACCSGCAPGREIWNWSIVRTLRFETKYHASERQIRRHEYQLARQNWDAYKNRRLDSGDWPDFGRGFRDGFAGFLHTGNLAPPPPPEMYRWFRGDGLSGQRPADAWLTGYRAGAIEAAKSGYRESLLVPVSASGVWRPQNVYPASSGAVAPETVPVPEAAVPNAPLPGDRIPTHILPSNAAPEAFQTRGAVSRQLTAGVPGFGPPDEGWSVGFESTVSEKEEPRILPDPERTW